MQNIEIIAETTDFLVINKPPAMPIEKPANTLTLTDWLAKQGRVDQKIWRDDRRFGVVHRLDADTSGLVVWALHPQAKKHLQSIWHNRLVDKTYLAITAGETVDSGEIDYPIKRSSAKNKMRVELLPINQKGRVAITRYNRLFSGRIKREAVSLLKIKPVTGRTHQIRVHLQAIKHPIIGDKLYSSKLSRQISHELNVNRQMLHAYQLKFDGMSFIAPLPSDFQATLDKAKISVRLGE